MLTRSELERLSPVESQPRALPCPRCDYDLRGASQMQCSECGHIATPRELRDRAAQLATATADVDALRDSMHRAWLGVGACGAVVIVLHLTGWVTLGALVAIVGGMALVGHGLQPLRSWLDTRAPRGAPVSSTATRLHGIVLALIGCLLIFVGFVW